MKFGYKLFGLTVIAISSFLTGCGTTAKFVYPANDSDLRQYSEGPKFEAKVAVPPFGEIRGDNNAAGTYALYLIPLMPGGWGTYERPDAARMFNTISEFHFDVSEDLAKAAAYSLRKSNLFSDAFFTFGADKDKANLILQGDVKSTTYKGMLWTYGLSVFGPVLWIVGLPVGTSRNDLVLNLRLVEVSSGKVLWNKDYQKSAKITQGLYYKFGYDVRGYSRLMQDIMNDAVAEMNIRLGKAQGQTIHPQP